MSIRKANESEPIEDASLQTLDVAETRGDELFWDKSVGSLMTGQTVTGVERARVGYRLSRGTAGTSAAMAREKHKRCRTVRREYRCEALGRTDP